MPVITELIEPVVREPKAIILLMSSENEVQWILLYNYFIFIIILFAIFYARVKNQNFGLFWTKIFDLTKACMAAILRHSEYITPARIIRVSPIELGTRIIYKENKMFILVCYRVFQGLLVTRAQA